MTTIFPMVETRVLAQLQLINSQPYGLQSPLRKPTTSKVLRRELSIYRNQQCGSRPIHLRTVRLKSKLSSASICGGVNRLGNPKTLFTMAPSWTHLVRFEAIEDGRIHLGQLKNTNLDVGLALEKGDVVQAYRINGDIFTGTVTSALLTVRRVFSPVTPEQCTYIRCVGLNYHDHAKEAQMSPPKVPILFTKPRTSLTDPYPSTITIPKIAQDGTSDYEAELCVVIGKSGRDIPQEDAYDHILGYTISNDVSARNLQFMTTQWSFSKGFDSSCPVGPTLVSAAAIRDPQGLGIEARHNGVVVQSGRTR
ncbi:hypothetical protein K470DRAFT_258060 [Piedraia hortae CBS 480.64]|uniref:Fumarylacetoacetase-like C-terminal domain-containing protein n=1 Tax=Piedraia hortae CBS 480.64 TaxID=1314780 RepID=A0A6A7BYL0_9PEZI|nr:hypothetical protein K470DRAFT_258060 [Piedraia hortae CBS 480.64]